MSTTSLADLAMIMCMIPVVALVWAIFLIPRYDDKQDEKEG